MVSDRAGESPRLKSLRCRETRYSCGHEQAIQFCRLKSGKLKRRKNANLFERVYAVIGVDSSFAFSFLRVLPEPNLQGSEESRGSHHSFFTYGPLWTCLVRRFTLSLPLKVNDSLFRQKQEQLYIMNLKQNAYE